jgi:hypothetical protein
MSTPAAKELFARVGSGFADCHLAAWNLTLGTSCQHALITFLASALALENESRSTTINVANAFTEALCLIQKETHEEDHSPDG